MSLSVNDLLRNLLAVPSVNPVFDTAQPGSGGESRLTGFLQSWVIEQGWQWLRQEVHPGRDNLMALISAGSGARAENVTLFEVHQDTVGITGMNIDPFGGVENDGRIYGRGACDVKGAMAAMLAALVQVTQARTPHGTILMAFTINEECGFTGAKALARLWTQHDYKEITQGTLALDELRQLRPHRVIVAEPTDFNVVVSHKGLVRWKCHTRGRAAHSSQPHQGRNAIYDMTDVVRAIQEFDREVLSQRGSSCICGRPTVSVNTIHGGTGANVVPDHAVIDIDHRLMPGERPDHARQEIIDLIASRISPDATIAHEAPWNESLGMQEGDNRAWAQQVATAASFDGRTSEIVGVPYGTDAWVFASMGIPTVVIGPGCIAQAHTEDEWISIAELQRGVEVYRRLASLS